MSLEIKVLVIDDMEAMRNIIKFNLVNCGYKTIDDCGNPIQSLEKIRDAFKEKRPYQLIICDLTMPKLSGAELVQQLRQDDAFRKVPVLMVIAHSDRKKADTIIQNGASDYIVKPFTKDQFREKIEHILK